MFACDKLKTSAVETNSPELWAEYKQSKNALNNLIKKQNQNTVLSRSFYESFRST